MADAALCDSPTRIRDLFTVILVFCQVSDALALWEKYKNSLSEDIIRQTEYELQGSASHVMDKIYNKSLILIEDAVVALGGKRLVEYGLPNIDRSGDILQNQELLKEISYDINDLAKVVSENENLLTDEQSQVYEQVLESIANSAGIVFFLDAPGGTGKTYLIDLLLAKLRKDRKVALAVASSGIAATLIEGAKTAHSAFKLPLNLIHVETTTCNIKKQSDTAQVLKECQLLVWDESTMGHKGGFEALSRTLKDVRENDGIMGGVTVLLAGDFRQTLPVIPRGTRADEVKACLKTSYLWPDIKKLSLKTNMRVHLRGDKFAESFSNLLMEIGNGDCHGHMSIPPGLGTTVSTLPELTSKIYPDIADLRNKPVQWICERAILSPKNESANEINELLLKSFDGQEQIYKSIDSVTNIDNTVNYPVEFLNTLNPPGLPAHKLLLKVGAPVMLLRNLKPPKLCNGTRLQVKTLQQNLVEATVLSGCGQGDSAYIKDTANTL